MNLKTKDNEFKYTILVHFTLTLGLLNAIIPSNALRIFTSYSLNFGNDFSTLLPFYIFIFFLSAFLITINYIFKFHYIVYIKFLTLAYFTSIITPIFITNGYNALLETLFIYTIVIIFVCLIEIILNKKNFYSDLFFKVVLIITFSTPLVDGYYIFNYLKNPDEQVNRPIGKIENSDIILNDKSKKTKNVFYIMFDDVAPEALLEKANLGSNLFFKKLNDGIYYNNAWTNGHRTTVSVNQHLNGYFLDYSKPFIHHLLRSKNIDSNYFLYQKYCTNRYSLTCYGLTELINHDDSSYFNYFYISKMLHALELRFNLPIFRALNLFSPNSYFLNFRKKFNDPRSDYNLVKLQLNKFDEKTYEGMENTYNFMYFLPPHIPYVYDKTCSLTSDPTVITLDTAIYDTDNEGYLNNITCMNYIILEFIKILKSKKIYDNSLIIITADHSKASADYVMKNKKGIEKLTFENLSKIQEHQEFFNKTVNRRANIPLWVKPAFHKQGLVYEDKMVISLDLPVTTLSALNLKEDNMPGLNILDKNVDDNTFNKRIKSMILYSQYGNFEPFTYLIENNNNWTIIEENDALNLKNNKFFLN